MAAPARSMSGVNVNLPRRTVSGLAQQAMPTKLSLLGSLSFSEHEGQIGLSCHVIEEEGFGKPLKGKMLDIVKHLWPTESPDPYCRTLRYLTDWSKRDFMIRLSRQGVLVRTDLVRALVEESRAVLVGAEESTAYQTFLQELKSHMDTPSDSDERPFLSRLVEALVCANVTLQTMRFQVLRPVARNILDNIRLDASEDSIMQLYPVKVALSTFTEQTKPIVECLHNLIHTDTSEREGAPSGWLRGRVADSRTASFINSEQGEPDAERSAASHVLDTPSPEEMKKDKRSFHADDDVEEAPEMEEILENWHNTAKEVLDDAVELTANIEDVMRFLEASMSCMRNRLLKLEYYVMVPTLALTCGNLIAGIFGMNLDPEAPFWGYSGGFMWCLIAIGFLGIMIGGSMLYMVNRSRTFYQANSAKFGNNRFFKEVGRDDYILSLMRTQGQTAVAEDHIRAAVNQHLHEPALPVRRDSSRRDMSTGGSFELRRPGTFDRLSSAPKPSQPLLSSAQSSAPQPGSD